jgi:hypothetical protein
MAVVSVTGRPATLIKALYGLWCDLMHDSLMWPIHGQYQCRACGRRYMVPWASQGERASHRQMFTDGVQLASVGGS